MTSKLCESKQCYNEPSIGNGTNPIGISDTDTIICNATVIDAVHITMEFLTIKHRMPLCLVHMHSHLYCPK